MKAKLNFSVLMSLYSKERPEFLDIALISVWDSQIVKPSEIVIVEDGPLNSELYQRIQELAERAPVKVIKLDSNKGLGIALQIGLEYCNNEIVARMDSDDICDPSRFQRQINFLINNPDISFLSSNIAEFDYDHQNVSNERCVPSNHSEIFKFSKLRNPMNHMAIMFRKRAVLDSGGYIPFLGYEDYYLWVRMLVKGYKAHNLEESLVYARVGNNMLARRQGYKFFKQELKLQAEFVKLGHINHVQFVRNIFLRGIPRLFPIKGLKMVYNYTRKNK
jgi:glycosyltransferase involved in cell wall biosynthesis